MPDKYYSREEITKRLRLKLRPEPASLLEKFRQLASGDGKKKRLPPVDRRLRA